MRPCLTHGCPTLVERGYCTAHRTTTTQRGYDYQWQKVSKAARAAQPWCSRCRATTDLTVDHVIPLAQGGDGRMVTVLCRSCNSKKGARASL